MGRSDSGLRIFEIEENSSEKGRILETQNQKRFRAVDSKFA